MMEVIEADAVVKGQTASSSYKPAVLENGERVMVPPHIETGTRIVRPEDASYVERKKLNLIFADFMATRSALINVMHQAATTTSRNMLVILAKLKICKLAGKALPICLARRHQR